MPKGEQENGERHYGEENEMKNEERDYSEENGVRDSMVYGEMSLWSLW